MPEPRNSTGQHPVTFCFRVLEPIPLYEAEPGDTLVIRLQTNGPVRLVRHIDDDAAADTIGGVLRSGALKFITCQAQDGEWLDETLTHKQAVRAILRRFPTPVPRMQLVR